MRCLHCGNRISLLRKLKDSEFCSDEHREFYALQQQQLAVSRLMETSSPRHPPLPGLHFESSSGGERALPKGTDRRGLAVAAEAPKPPRRNAGTPSPPVVAAEIAEVREAAPAPPVEAAPVPPAAAGNPSRSPSKNSHRMHGYVSQFPSTRDCDPEQRRAIAAEAVDLFPMLAAPRLESKTRRRQGGKGMVRISGSHEWPRRGALTCLAVCDEWIPPGPPATFSEILSLSLHGVVWKQALQLDRTPCVADPAETPEPAFDPRMPLSAAEGLGANQLPGLQAIEVRSRLIEAAPGPWQDAPAGPTLLVRASLAIRGRLPDIDWTAERLDRIAATHEPGMVRLRSPRARSPQMARLVKPAAWSSGPPIRVRPAVRPPVASLLRSFKLAMPAGAKVALCFDTPVAGEFRHVDPGGEPHPFTCQRTHLTRPADHWSPGMALAGLQGLRLNAASGVALTEVFNLALEPETSCPVTLPRGPFVRGNEFDPPSCGMVRLVLTVEPQRKADSRLSMPPSRPVVSYRWIPVKPELGVAPDADWTQVRRAMAPLTLNASAPAQACAVSPEEEIESLHADGRPSLEAVRLVPKVAVRASHPTSATRMFPISLDDCVPKAGISEPKTKLEQIIPKPGHQLRKSSLKTQADWERNRWTSASMYGSALWRIAIGRFSGALDQAPKAVRWIAGLAALALAAFAIFPAGPTAPADTGWTMANNPGPAATETAPPAPRKIKPPVRTVAAKPPRPARAQPAASGGNEEDSGASLTSAWGNFQKRLSDRAAVAFTDDFRNGLAEWEGSGDWARSWSYDASGFVRTGGLAVLAPARDLTDYRMEFLGQIERRSMGWVVRAADLRNYYALKLTIISDGPVPEVALIRYPVINGAAGAASQQILPIDVRGDTVYRVQTDVRGDYIAVTVQGKMVDSWTERRLKRGSIGLFSGKGELARVRWVGVWHQYDTLGRLCALLAPGGLPGRERGANQ